MRPKKEINWRIGSNIQAAREAARYTQEQLSEKLGVTPNHLSAIERGAAGASFEVIERICLTLGVSADYLLFGKADLDSPILRMAQQLNEAAPEHREQVKKVLAALLEMVRGNDG